MNDILKLLLLLLPVDIRIGLYDLCSAIATPWQRLADEFRAWQCAARLDAATTWQVISLQHLLNERILGVGQTGITITDADEGLPYDFVINIPVGINFNKQLLNALVTKYKLYGKRFFVGKSIYTYSFEWGDYVAEQVECTYDFVWSNFVNEQNLCTYNFEWYNFVNEQYDCENYVHGNDDNGIADVTFDYPVTSIVSVHYQYFGTGGTTRTGTVTVAVGLRGCMFKLQGTGLVITGVSPAKDAKWNYLI